LAARRRTVRGPDAPHGSDRLHGAWACNHAGCDPADRAASGDRRGDPGFAAAVEGAVAKSSKQPARGGPSKVSADNTGRGTGVPSASVAVDTTAVLIASAGARTSAGRGGCGG